MAETFQTHDVFNQPPPLQDLDLFSTDRALQEGVEREGAGWARDALDRFGGVCGSAEMIALGALANRYPPVLHTHDRYGNRRDEVEFHPAWHELLALGCAEGLHAAPWADPRPGAQVARAAAYLIYGQVENGAQCPLTMTYAANPVLSKQVDVLPWLKDIWLPRMQSREYDRRFVAVEQKRGVLVGMGMTEKQGGSDVRANLTRAQPFDKRGAGQMYRIVGHKWFFSAPMCDAFLLLAQAAAGVSCFFVPRFLPDGGRNELRLQRLKDKLGNRSNASSEVEFTGATGWLLGEEGRGVPTIVEMATYRSEERRVGKEGRSRWSPYH